MSDLDIRIWEIGAGLCVRIRTPSGHTHIIDAGCSDNFSPAEHIYFNHWRDGDTLDYLIISHQDADHTADLPNIKKYLGEPRVYLRNKTVPDNEKYGILQRLYQKILKLFDEKYTATIDWANDPRNQDVNGGVKIEHAFLSWEEAKTINNTSIVVAYSYKNIMVIFPGDIEDYGWNELIRKKPELFNEMLKESHTVILIAPHHGRPSGYSQNMIDYFKPDLVVISDGYGAGETDQRFRTCAAGLEIKGAKTKYITTKTKGRKRITIHSNGYLDIHESSGEYVNAYQ